MDDNTIHLDRQFFKRFTECLAAMEETVCITDICPARTTGMHSRGSLFFFFKFCVLTDMAYDDGLVSR